MWQVYICDENGEMKPFVKPFTELRTAETFVDLANLAYYEIRKV